MLLETFRKLSKFPLLAVIPVVVDGLSVLLGVALHGFHGNPHFTLKLALQMGLPSISAVTEQGLMPGSVQIASVGGFTTSNVLGVLFYLALFLLVQSFLQGGYVGLLYEAVNGRRLSMELFAACGVRFFGRFLLLDILVLTFLFMLGGLAVAILKMPGVIVFMFIFLLLRVLFLFLEFTLVADDCSIFEAFSRSRDAFPPPYARHVAARRRLACRQLRVRSTRQRTVVAFIFPCAPSRVRHSRCRASTRIHARLSAHPGNLICGHLRLKRILPTLPMPMIIKCMYHLPNPSHLQREGFFGAA